MGDHPNEKSHAPRLQKSSHLVYLGKTEYIAPPQSRPPREHSSPDHRAPALRSFTRRIPQGALKYPLKIEVHYDMKDPAEHQESLLIKVQKHLLENLQLSLTHVHEAEGEVCQLNSPELRPEFRLTFTQKDVLDYLYALRHDPKSSGEEMLLPPDTGMFWQRVQMGREMRALGSRINAGTKN